MQTQLDRVNAHNMFLRDKLLDKSSYASKVSTNAIVYGATSTVPAIPVNASIGNNKSGSLHVRPKTPNLPSLASNQQSTILLVCQINLRVMLKHPMLSKDSYLT